MSGDEPGEKEHPGQNHEASTPHVGSPASPAPDGGPTTLPYEVEPENAPPVIPEPGFMLLGRYTVLGTLGQGSMGVVLSVYDARLDRRVAFKLMRPWSGRESRRHEEQARFVREAQAMARLNHPNVVAVYDSGTLDDGALFIAMEYVEGQTLRRWQKGRPWREVLAQYLAAGQGLAAAHEAGLIHHDFKPDNVLVGNDGRARVTDFGLVWLESSPEEEALPLPEAIPLPRPTASLARLTHRSSLWMGTPSYMADEQFRGRRGDARSDLYAFCVALYEGVHGQMPFRGNTVAELREAQRAGRIEPPENTQVPTRVTRTLLHGLHSDPAKRPSSMKELLRALADDPEARRRAKRSRWAVVGLVAAASGLALWAWAHPREQECDRMALRLSGVWDETVKGRVEQGLLATGVPYARATAERVLQRLDSYAGAWVKQRVALCVSATQEAHLETAELLLLEEGCLERRRSQLRALTTLLSQSPDTQLLSRAVEAVQALPSLEYCGDAKALTAAIPPPEDPVQRAKVEALQEQVDSLQALQDAGRVKQGLAMVEVLLPQVKAAGDAPLLARTLFILAWLKDSAGDYRSAAEILRDVMAVAARGKDSLMLARASSSLAWMTSNHLMRPQDAMTMVPITESIAELAGDDRIRGFAANTLGTIFSALRRPEQARQAYERALELRQKVLGPEHGEVASTLNNLGILFQRMGKLDEALDAHTRVLALRRKALGPEHPRVAESLSSLGSVYKELGRFDEALESCTQALELNQKVLGPEHPQVAEALHCRGDVLQSMGRLEEALEEHTRGRAVREKVLGFEHPALAESISEQGHVLQDMGRFDEALAAHTRVLDLRQRLGGPDDPSVADALNDQGDALRGLHRDAEAREKYARALALQDKVLTPADPWRVGPLLGMGRVLLAQGRPAEALPFLEKALELAPMAERPRVQFALAQALWETHGDRSRAIGLVTQAWEYWRRVGRATEAEQASSWLKQHGPSQPSPKGPL
ncbi:tetratricopeptide repeat protein [Hyalangium versicolor]|uniref:serine/threonine-protein kinase n=1 Tax=Hyalangium versicolor TaxID=2861190 RepID=UPI001CCDD86B|nr:serine/threonine-protein kinase [Hyalangium versicolor]